MVFKELKEKLKRKEVVVCVVGLGYVGIPLAEAFSKHLNVIGYDINEEKIKKLRKNNKNSDIEFTSDPSEMKKADFILICVPTPVTKSKEPDLAYVKSAAKIVGKNLKKGVIVVLESTVYPGVTEEVVVPILEKVSGLKCGVDFKVGYSPERINPGDDEHTIDKIVKIVAGMDEETTEILAELYGLITTVYKTPSIKVAEAAKVIENVQRDINIALFNELAILFDKLGIDSKEVFDAAATKWNFLRFSPGFVGGHCIPVDPYYLAYKAMESGYIPELILAGRRINEYVPNYIAQKIVKLLIATGRVPATSRVLVLGATYKENVPDLRESKVRELLKELQEFGVHDIAIYEPLIPKDTIFGVPNSFSGVSFDKKFDVVVYAVPHDAFKNLDILKLLNENGIVIDIKRKLNKHEIEERGYIYWGL